MSKPKLLIIDKLQQFSADIARALGAWYEVQTIAEPDPASIGKADVIWCEWADDNLVRVSQIRRPSKVVFTRLHGYEAIEADYLRHVQWGNIDCLVGVSRQMLDHAAERFGALPVKQVVIPNALDLSRYGYRKRQAPQSGGNVAWVSLLNNKKNIPIIFIVAQAFPEYTFHVSGRWQDPRLEKYFWHRIEDDKINNVIYSGWHGNMDAFLEDKDYLLNASLWESFSFAIHEAMAKGIKPLIHRWVGWDEYFPREMTWGSLGDLKTLLEGPYESERYRDMCERFNVPVIAGRYHEMIEELRAKRG